MRHIVLDGILGFSFARSFLSVFEVDSFQCTDQDDILTAVLEEHPC